MPYDLWSFRRQLAAGDLDSLSGYQVHATDGPIGSVGETNEEAGSSHILVSSRAWVFGKTMMLPAGIITRLDHPGRRVYLDRDKAAISKAPKYDEQLGRDPDYHSRLGAYYGRAGM
ncbi:MAG: hypothetical protein L0Y54_10835 [Sporichthyaceae bacterium]|nr:hypothetical protein [Sporichthyaceae bacterium]